MKVPFRSFKMLWIFVLLLTFGILLVAACSPKEHWSIDDGKLIIEDDKGMIEWTEYVYSKSDTERERIMESIETIELKQGVTVIKTSSFALAHNLKEVYMADSVYRVEDCAFYDCSSLKTIHWSKNLQIIGAESFASCGLEEIYLPEKVTEIADAAFYDCKSLKRLVVGKEINDISGILELHVKYQLVFLGRPPSGYAAFFQNQATVYFLNENRPYWSPNGEMHWKGLPIVGIDSLDDLPPIE